MKTVAALVIMFAVQSAWADVDVENSVCESFTLGGYLDLGYIEYGKTNTIPSREFTVLRSGLETTASFSSNLDVELKVEFKPDEMYLKNALFKWNPFSTAEVRAGQFRRETLLGGELSTWDLPLFDRPLVYELCEELTYAGRDLGFDFKADVPLGNFMTFTGTAGVFNGDELGEERVDSELLLSLRAQAQILPVGLTLGGSMVTHSLGQADPDEIEGYMSTGSLNAYSADVCFHHSFNSSYSLDLYTEYATGDNWAVCDPYTDEEIPEFQGLWSAVVLNHYPAGIPAIHMLSFSAGFDRVEENTDEDDVYQKQISLAGALYPSENTRFRLGVVRCINGEDATSTETDEYTNFFTEVGFRF